VARPGIVIGKSIIGDLADFADFDFFWGVRVRTGRISFFSFLSIFAGVFAILFATYATFGVPVAHAQSEDAKKQAQALQVEGVRLMQKGDNRGAVAKFNEAFALVQSPKIMFNLGKAYRALGNDVEALRAFDIFLDEAPFAPKASRAEAEREVQALRPKLAYIEVDTEDTASTVRIDGREMGKSPLVRPVVVAPGTHAVKVEKTGMVTETRSVAPIAGQKLRVVVKLSPVPPPEVEKKVEKLPVVVTRPPPPPDDTVPRRRRASIDTDKPDTTEPVEHPPGRIDSPPVEPPPPAPERPWQFTAAWVSAGISALALAGGITAQVLWSQKNAQFNSLMVPGHPDQVMCTTSSADFGGGSCPALHQDANLRLTLAIAGYATAGAAAIGALVFYLTAPSSGEARAPAGNSVSLACLPGASSSSGLSCTLTTRF
jgi:PEGA domain